MEDLPTPDVEAYVNGNQQACYVQLVDFLSTPPGQADPNAGRALAFEIASQVGAHYCFHLSAPEPLGDMSHAKRKKAAADHLGLCGVYHASVIAAVKTGDVVQKWNQTTGNKYRNQACYDGAAAMNAHGGGVQLPRAECFTHACRALWPGSGDMDAGVVKAFSS